MKELFEKNVRYLQKNVPPDDIYLFAEQTFMAAMFFLKKWSDSVDMVEECKKDVITQKWILNILGFHKCRVNDEDIEIDLNLNSLEDE